MSKINNVLRKIDNRDYMLKLFMERSDFLERENVMLRNENVRLVGIQKELVRELSERMFKK